MLLWASVSWAGCVLIAILLSAVLGPKAVPPDFSRGDQCEQLHPDSSVMETENTWSNVGYLFAGLLIFFRNIGTKRLIATIYGGSLIALAWLSGLYHAQPVSDLYRHLDVATIYWVLPFLLLYALHGMFAYTVSGGGWQPDKVIGVSLLILLLGLIIAIKSAVDSTILTLIFVTILVVLTVWILFFRRLVDPLWDIEKAVYSTVIGILLIASGLPRFFDGHGEFLGIDKFLCSETSIVQAHACWHLFSAATLLVGYNLFSRAFSDGGTVFPD